MQPLPPGALRVVHLSDTHLLAGGALHQGVVDTTEALDRVLAEAGRVEGVRLLVGSGDLSDDGSRASYALLRDRLAAWAGPRGVAVVLAPGNHDLRAGFAAELGDGHAPSETVNTAPGDDDAPAEAGPIDGVTAVDGWRVVTLDTSVPRAGYGELRPAQLAWLRDLLAAPAEQGTVLVLHHPPLPAPTTLHESLALQAPEALVATIADTDVRVVLAGHYHHHVVGSAAGVPVVVAPAVANDTDVAAPVGTERAVRGSGFVVVDLLPVTGPGAAARDGVRSTPVRVAGPGDGDEVFALDEQQVLAIAAAAGAPGPDVGAPSLPA